MLHSPKAPSSHGTFLGAGRERLSDAIRVETHAGGGGEGAKEAGEEVGHRGSHNHGEDGENKGNGGELQIAGWQSDGRYRRNGMGEKMGAGISNMYLLTRDRFH